MTLKGECYLVEEMVRRSSLNEEELEHIEFYHHFIDN